jgi:hypothetical protein
MAIDRYTSSDTSFPISRRVIETGEVENSDVFQSSNPVKSSVSQSSIFEYPVSSLLFAYLVRLLCFMA